jgi:hypothetical protein
MKLRIGDLLIQYAIISQEQLDEALHHQGTSKKRLGEILMELGYLTSKDLIWILSEQADIPFVEVNVEMLDPVLVNRFPEALLQENAILPLYETEQAVYIAQGDPTDSEKTDAFKACTEKPVIVSGADPAAIQHVLDRFYLAQRLHMTEQNIEDVNTLRIVADRAYIEMTSDTGQVMRTTGPIDACIRYTRDKKPQKKDGDNE